MKTAIALITWAAALVGAASIPMRPNDIAVRRNSFARDLSLEQRATCRPINYTFQTTVPPAASTSQGAPAITFAGYTYKLPQAINSGEVISFFGNFANNQTTTSQVTTITNSTTNDDPNAPSKSSATGSANGTTIVATTFSQGDASSGAGATNSSPGDSSTSTSSSSSGAANSTVKAASDALGVVTIYTNATTAAASNAQSLQNERQAAAATSCAASNDGASAEAESINSVSFQTSSGVDVTQTAYAACQAGLDAPSSGSSSSGSQASVSGVSASVVCNGVTTTNTESSTIYRIAVVGSFCKGGSASGFTGAVTGQRVADSRAEC